jgi:hypothetical protein
LAAAQELRLLNVSGSHNVTNELAAFIADRPNLGRLESLVLPQTRITDVGVLALAKSPHLPRLRMMNLVGCRIRRDGAAANELRTRFGNYF